jgi:hypothetical protein
VGFEGAHLLARDRGGLTELEAAFLLNVCLLDDVHVALELCDFLSIRAVALNHEGGWPEKDHGGRRRHRVIRRVLVLRARCNCGASGDSRGFLAQLRARKPLILEVRPRPLLSLERDAQPAKTDPDAKCRLCERATSRHSCIRLGADGASGQRTRLGFYQPSDQFLVTQAAQGSISRTAV